MQTVDPVKSKNQIKASIANAIAKLVTGANRDEMALRVEETTRDFSMAPPFLRISHRLQRAPLDEK